MKSKIFSLVALGFLATACGTTDKQSAEMAGDASGVAIAPGSYEDFRVNVGDRVFFDFDRSDLTAEGRTILENQAQWLAKYRDARITLEGHCDIRGTREYNMGLGARRAHSIKMFLISKGVDASRIHTVSYGKERPEFEGDSEDVHYKNRRGVTVVQ